MTSSPASDLRVALVHWTWPPTTGGVESHLFELARLLTSQGAQVTVLTGEGRPDPIEEVEIVSIPDLALERIRRLPELRSQAAARHYRDLFASVLLPRKVTVVHGHNLHHFSPAPALALDALRQSHGFRLFHTFHETWPDVLASYPVHSAWEGSFAVSEHVRHQCSTLLGFLPTLLRLGVDLHRFAAAESSTNGPTRILHPARLLPWKGVHVSVDMLRLLRERGVDAHLTITDTQRIADWNHELRAYRRWVLERAHVNGVLDQIEFRSARFEEMPALYAEADVVVYPTVGEEPFGLVPLEAMSCSRPVVASRSGGIVETILDGVTGYLVERNDPEQLADRVEALSLDPELRCQLGRAGRQRVEELFDARAYASTIALRYLNGSPVSEDDRP